jgi:hypothetical protein
MGATVNIRLPYAMQLGSGTYDLEPALTYTQSKGAYSWGSQYAGILRTGRNSQGYTLGNKHKLSVWGGYQWSALLGSTLRVTGEHEGKIEGRDDQIAGPNQTTHPDNYGGDRVEVGLGLNVTPTGAAWDGHEIGIEASLPVYQDLNGPQMERDYGVTARWRVKF